MKKLLSMLGLLGLTTTASIPVVACGIVDDDNADVNDIEVDTDALIADLSNEISQILDNAVKGNRANLTQLIEETTSNAFLNKDTLTAASESTSENNNVYTISDEESLNKLNQDIQEKIAWDSVKTEIENLKTLDKYSYILSGVDSVISEALPSAEIKINEVKDADEIVQISVDITYQIKFNYILNNTQTTYQTPASSTFTWMCLNDQEVQEQILNVQNNLGINLFNDGNMHLNESDLGLDDTPFLTYGASGVNIDQQVLVKSKGQDIIDEINSILGLENAAIEGDNPTISFVFDTDYNYDHKGNYDQYRIDASNLLFGPVGSFAETFKESLLKTEFIDKKVKVNNVNLYEEWLEKNGLSNESESLIFSYSNFKINGYKVQIGNIEYELGELSIPYDYSVQRTAFESLIKDSGNTKASELLELDTNNTDLLLTSDYAYIIAYDILMFREDFGFVTPGVSTNKFNSAGYAISINDSNGGNFWSMLEKFAQENDGTLSNLNLTYVFNSSVQGQKWIKNTGLESSSYITSIYSSVDSMKLTENGVVVSKDYDINVRFRLPLLELTTRIQGDTVKSSTIFFKKTN